MKVMIPIPGGQKLFLLNHGQTLLLQKYLFKSVSQITIKRYDQCKICTLCLLDDTSCCKDSWGNGLPLFFSWIFSWIKSWRKWIDCKYCTELSITQSTTRTLHSLIENFSLLLDYWVVSINWNTLFMKILLHFQQLAANLYDAFFFC